MRRSGFPAARALRHWVTLVALFGLVLWIGTKPANAVTIVGTQTGPNEWTYDLTFAPLDNYSIFQPSTTITIYGLCGVTSASPPTSTDFAPPGGFLDTVNLAWTPTVTNGGSVVQWTHVGSGTGNFGVAKHIFGFKITTTGASVNAQVPLVTSGFSRDTGNALHDGSFKLDIAVVVNGPFCACPPHRVHGHISTVPEAHTSNTSHEHLPQHFHTIPFNCPSHVPGHSAGLLPEPEGELFNASVSSEAAEPDFVASITTESPASGTVVQLFGSAVGLFLEGPTERSAATFVAPAAGPLYHTTALPEVQIGGVAAKVLFSGLAPGLIGIWQIDVLVPPDAPRGRLPVTISYGGDGLKSVDIEVK